VQRDEASAITYKQFLINGKRNAMAQYGIPKVTMAEVT
jgi:hypothetical protein